jgi:cytochrome oxidase Cu insertion factor (SCO1/SenC/PrrC family)
MNEEKMNKVRSRILFLALIALFVIPFIGAEWLYQRTRESGVWNTSNRGVLVQPARLLQTFSLIDQAGKQYDVERFRGHWTFVFVASSPCDELCRKNIYHMRQVWISLGRDSNRLQRLLLLSSDEQKSDLREFLEIYPQTDVVIDMDDQLIHQMIAANPAAQPAIMLVDPLTNIMMSFPQSMDPGDILKDLRKLLKISQTG